MWLDRGNGCMAGHRKLVRHDHEPGELHELTFSCYRRMPHRSSDRKVSLPVGRVRADAGAFAPAGPSDDESGPGRQISIRPQTSSFTANQTTSRAESKSVAGTSDGSGASR